MSRRSQAQAALVGLVACTAIAVVVPLGTVRPFLVLAAALVVPGAAALTLLDVGEPLVELAVAVALSIAIDLLGSLALVWSEFWHPAAFAAALGTASVGLLLTDIRRSLAPPDAASPRDG